MTGFPRMTSTQGASTTLGVALTAPAGGSENTKGSWTALHAATEFDGFLLNLAWHDSFTSATYVGVLCDIGIDAAGGTSYTVVVPNVIMGGAAATSGQFGTGFLIPVHIPAGSTIAGRIQSTIADKTVFVHLAMQGGVPSDNPYPQHGLVVDYGTSTSDSGGTAQANANADVKSAWTELVAATTHPHTGITLSFQPNDSTLSSGEGFIDIGVGASSAEQVVVADVYYRAKNNESAGVNTPSGFLIAPGIPEGSRLAARWQGSTNNQGASYDVIAYGWG